MERFSQRESILLGYSPQNSFVNSSSSPSTSLKSSDVDFHDVFGGPPRRSSIHEMRYSFNDVRVTNRIPKVDDDDDDEEEEEKGWSEKPVFGEESLNRSRTHSDDFFDDIFKGSSSMSSSPRRVHRDPYSSSPGSRVLSSAQPLPPKPDSALLPVQFSLPAKLTKAVDSSPAIGSITRTTSLSRFSSQALQGPESLTSDIRSSHRMSSLSQKISVSGEGSSNMAKNDGDDDTQSNFKEDSKSSVSPTSGNPFQFHFSIYKWASKPMAMPLRGRSGSRVHTTKNEEQSSTYESADDKSMARESPISTLPNVDDQLLADSSSSTLESNKQENDSLASEEVQVEPSQIIKDTILPVFGSSEAFSSLNSTVENDVACDTVSCDWPKKDDISCHWQKQNNISCQTSAEFHRKASYEDPQKEHPVPELKPTHFLFFDDDFGQGTAERAKLAGANTVDSTVKADKYSSVDVGSSKNMKNQNGKRSSLTNTQVDKATPQSSPRKENLGRNKVKGNVKDFVKMFSHEVSSKAEDDGDFGSQRFKKKEKSPIGIVKEKSPIEPVNEATTKTPTWHEELQNSNVKKTFTEASIKTVEDLKQSEKEACEAKTAKVIPNNVPGQYVSASSSVSNSSKGNIGDTDGSFHENFQIKEITQEEKTPPQVSDDLEEIQAIDAKIRQWSKGKEGNMRSLLTTVQHILWPGSGWKTVPLVDIIEGNAVKRSYQRALLCLHPDKLQQKGVTPQQKYIAAKVFDILQEAWDHFNSLGPL